MAYSITVTGNLPDGWSDFLFNGGAEFPPGNYSITASGWYNIWVGTYPNFDAWTNPSPPEGPYVNIGGSKILASSFLDPSTHRGTIELISAAKMGISFFNYGANQDTGATYVLEEVITVTINTLAASIPAGHGRIKLDYNSETIYLSNGETHDYTSDTTVTVTPVPYTNYVLDHWEIDGSPIGTDNSLLLMDSNHTVSATFRTTSKLADSSWPKFAYDIRNTGRRPPPYFDIINTAYRIPKWWVNLPSGTIAAPAVAADGTIYVAGIDGILYAINPDGNFKWGYNTYSTLFTTPAIAPNETIYVGADNSNLYVINPNGTAKWVYGLGGSIQSSPAIADDNTIYINSFDGRLWAITDLGDSGVLKWTPHTIGSGYASYNPVTIGTNGNIYVGSSEGILEAINPTNGSLVWSYSTNDLLETCPAISDTGIIYIGDYAGKLHSILPNGTPVAGWPHNLGSGAISSPSLIYTGNVRTVYIATYNGILYAIDTDIDDSSYYNIKWSTLLPGDITASPTIGSDGTIYIGTLAGRFYAISPIDGSIQWSYTTLGQIKGSAAIDPNGVVYVGSAEQDEFGNYIGGRLYAFAPPSAISIAGCPGDPKYSGDAVTLQATPKDGTGPYYVEFRKDGVIIDPSRLVDGLGNPTSNPIIDSPEDIQLARVYTLDDIDIVGAIGGTIDFSVHIEDKCPAGVRTCTESCIVTAGCLAPICNFTVT